MPRANAMMAAMTAYVHHRLRSKLFLKASTDRKLFHPPQPSLHSHPTTRIKNFKFSCIWKVPRLVMKLSSGCLTITNISFHESDAVLASEDMLISLLILQHLSIDLRTLLKRNRAMLDGTDCSAVAYRTASKRVDLWDAR